MYLNETKVKHRCYKTLQRSIKIISITILEEQNTLQLAEAITHKTQDLDSHTCVFLTNEKNKQIIIPKITLNR